MFNRWVLAAFESWAVVQLLRSQAFHRAVRGVHRQIHRMRNGTPLEEMGGTKMDVAQRDSFLKHFVDELKDQGGWKANKRK